MRPTETSERERERESQRQAEKTSLRNKSQITMTSALTSATTNTTATTTKDETTTSEEERRQGRSTNNLLRIGILGCASISNKTVLAICNSQHSNCCVTAVASRNIEKARQFVQNIFPNTDLVDKIKIYGGGSGSGSGTTTTTTTTGYDELIEDKDNIVDAIYIPLPTSIKKEYVIKCLRFKKHVVIEKPTALCLEDLHEMYFEAYKNNKFLLDGTMFPHHPRTNHILSSLVVVQQQDRKNNTNNDDLSSNDVDVHVDNTIGEVNRIECNFTFLADEEFINGGNIRARNGRGIGGGGNGGDPQGCIGDLGWYCIRYGLLVYKAMYNNIIDSTQVVISVQVVHYELNQYNVPIDATCYVKFQNVRFLFVLKFRTNFD